MAKVSTAKASAEKDAQRVLIFDTTLRDGEQALQQSLTPKQKLQIALVLEQLGVDIIEAGFPISSPGDMEAVRLIGKTLKTTVCCGLARAIIKDIDACAEALNGVEHFRIHTFIATSDIHAQSKLHKSQDSILDMAVNAVKYARRFTDDVEFSCEDAGRTNIDNLCRMVEAAIRAGATTVNIPDTVGYTLPYEWGGILRTLFERVPNIHRAVVSVHCHNDLGMATANSLTGVMEGARQIECCVNGLGERAGNTSLEEVVMAMKLRSARMGGVYTGIINTNIARASQVVAGICNEPVPAHKAIVGANAFAHSSGIHQDGVLKNKQTYEILTPESVGFTGNNMRMTARSGRHMIKAVLEQLGYPEGTYNLDDIYTRFLKLADRKGQVFDYDLETLLFFSHEQELDTQFTLDSLSVISGGKNVIPTATVRLKIGRRTRTESGTGNGPVDAVFNCITRLTGIKLVLDNFQIGAKGAGMNAQGQVDVDVIYNHRHYHGKGLSTDVIEASALALLSACNSIYRARIIAGETAEEAAGLSAPEEKAPTAVTADSAPVKAARTAKARTAAKAAGATKEKSATRAGTAQTKPAVKARAVAAKTRSATKADAAPAKSPVKARASAAKAAKAVKAVKAVKTERARTRKKPKIAEKS